MAELHLIEKQQMNIDLESKNDKFSGPKIVIVGGVGGGAGFAGRCRRLSEKV